MIICELREIEEHLNHFQAGTHPSDGITQEQILVKAQLAIRVAAQDVKTHRHYHNDAYADSLEAVLKVTKAVYLRMQNRCPQADKRCRIVKDAYSRTSTGNIPLTALNEGEPPNEFWNSCLPYLSSSDWQALRRVNQTYLQLVDDFLRLRWEQLKRSPPSGFVDIRYLMQRIESELSSGVHLILFKELKREFVRLGAAISAEKLPTTPAEFEDLQRQVGPEYEKSLCALRDHLISLDIPNLQGLTAQQFQAWINDPKNSEGLDRINTINLNRSELTLFPYEMRQFRKLKMLYLSENKIQWLPKEIGLLTELKILKLNSNQIQSLPKEIGKLKELMHLFLENNQLQFLPQEIKNFIKLKFLFLQQNQLQSLPNEIGFLENLEELNLTGNQLSSLPPDIGSLSNLKKCSIEDNQLVFLPEEMGKCICLTELFLSSNLLSSLPKKFKSLTRLIKLNLSHNQFQQIPQAICTLSRLDYLSFDYNQLQELPAEIAGMTSLQKLFLEGNQLKTLPPEFGRLKNLRSLIISHNQLKSMPAVIKLLTNLHGCFHEGNPFT